MPSVFLSPSTQHYNLYVTGAGHEENFMNQVADAMQPYLTASGITYYRNDPDGTVGTSVRMSNAVRPDAHLALHTNASPERIAGQVQGIDAFFYRGSAKGENLAQLVADNLAVIYPHPELVGTTPTRELYELNNTNAPATLVEIGYHDNVEDANWITSNINPIAQMLSLALTQYFGIPFVAPSTVQRGTITTEGFSINLRDAPAWSANPVAVIPNGASVIVTGQSGGWYIINYNGQVGYVASRFVTLT